MMCNRWRTEETQPPTLIPPPQAKLPKTNPPKKLQMPSQPNLNTSNTQDQQVYSGEIYYLPMF